MTAPVFLALFAIVASGVGSRVLSRSAWVQRAPRWGIWAWQSLTFAVTSAVLLVCATLALPALPVRADVALLFGTTPFSVAEHYTTPAGVALAIGSACMAVALLARITTLTGLQLRNASQLRGSQRATLALIATPHPDGFVVVDHPTRLVYCLPGRRRVVVVTSSALAALGPRELRLVLAHERTHLRARHDLALAMAAGLDRAFRGWGVFGHAHRQIETLVEMQADDSAREIRDRQALARALVTLCTGSAPSSALAAGDTEALLRVKRLTASPARPLTRRHGVLVCAVTIAVLSTPLVLALAPALEAAITNCWAVTHGA